MFEGHAGMELGGEGPESEDSPVQKAIENDDDEFTRGDGTGSQGLFQSSAFVDKGWSVRLSEAIRLGSMLRQQTFGDLYRAGRSCAMGAAYEAAGLMSETTDRSRWVELWAALTRAVFPIIAMVGPSCPVCRFGGEELAFIITHINDDHHWTREQIADWVEGIESARQPESEPATSINAVREDTDQPVVTLRD